MTNPTLLNTFVEVVNRHSMAEAARFLKITPAAVTKHIKALEAEVGVQLFKRSTRKLELTYEGTVFLEHAKQILDAYKKAEAALSQSKEEPTGSLKIICGPQFGYMYLLPNLKEFRERYPKLHIHLELTQMMPDIEKEKVDLIVGLTANIPQNCIQRSLMHARWVLCASPEYLKKYGTPKKPSDLLQHQILTHTSRKDTLDFKTGESITFDPSITFNDTRAMRRAALHSSGIVKLHDYIVAQDIKEQKLVELLPKHMEQERTIPLYVAYLQTSHVHIKIRKFIDFLLEKLKD